MKTTLKPFLLFFALFSLLWVVRATVFFSAVDLSMRDDTTRLVFSSAVKFLLWVVPAAIYVAWLERENPLASFKLITVPDGRGLAQGAIVTVLFFVAVFSFEKFTSGRTLLPLIHTAPAAWLATLAQVWFSPICEEIMFRGFVLPQLNAHMSFWRANLLQALLFTAMHWPNWIWTGGWRGALVAQSIGVLAIGVLLGWLVRRTNSLWPPVLAHIANNFLVAFLG